MKDYKPAPIETSEVELDSELDELIEQLAESNHDHWASQRLKEGWRHGSSRSDPEKTHPGLVRYEDLAESEKEYDRTSVVETLKAIIALGYEVKRRSE